MPLVLDAGKPFPSTEQAEQLVTLLLRLSNMVVHDLDRLAFEPILSQVETESGDVAYSARGWCEGFGMGMDLRAAQWDQALRDDPHCQELLKPVLDLAADEGVFGNDEDGEDPTPLSEAEYEAALNGLPNAVLGFSSIGGIGTSAARRNHPPALPSRRIRTRRHGGAPSASCTEPRPGHPLQAERITVGRTSRSDGRRARRPSCGCPPYKSWRADVFSASGISA
jgi:yecA family protein